MSMRYLHYTGVQVADVVFQKLPATHCNCANYVTNPKTLSRTAPFALTINPYSEPLNSVAFKISVNPSISDYFGFKRCIVCHKHQMLSRETSGSKSRATQTRRLHALARSRISRVSQPMQILSRRMCMPTGAHACLKKAHESVG